MTLDEFLSLVKMGKVNWELHSNGTLKPCSINWLVMNLCASGITKFEKCISLGLSKSSSYALSDAVGNPCTEHMILRMELEDLCRSS